MLAHPFRFGLLLLFFETVVVSAEDFCRQIGIFFADEAYEAKSFKGETTVIVFDGDPKIGSVVGIFGKVSQHFSLNLTQLLTRAFFVILQVQPQTIGQCLAAK